MCGWTVSLAKVDSERGQRDDWARCDIVFGDPSLQCFVFGANFFLAFSNSASADRSGVAASMLFAVVAACIMLVSFAAGRHKSYCSGCIKVAMLILRQFF